MQSHKYTILFSLVICVCLSFILSTVCISLKDRQLLNQKLDEQKNILKAAGFNPKNKDEIEYLFDKRIDVLFIGSNGEIIKENQSETALPLYRVLKKDSNKVEAYVYPLQGKGLWSTLYSYLAVTPNGRRIKGITFYKHGETPGLGAEISKDWFCNNFKGKYIYKKDKIIGVEVVKGKAKENINYKTKAKHMVDGMSGATLTGNGVTKMLQVEPYKYAKFFEKIKK